MQNTTKSNLNSKAKKRILLASLIALTVGNMMIMNATAVLPNFIKHHDWDSSGKVLDEGDISLILSIFSVAQIIFAPFNRSIKGYFGSKNTLVLGFVIMTLTTAALGIIARIRDPNVFMVAACVLRFL